MTDHYLKCGEEGCTSTGFSVVRDEEGVIKRFECKRCGSTAIKQGPTAPSRVPA